MRKTRNKQVAEEEPILSLPKLDPRTLRTSCLIGLISQKGGGKTTLLKDLVEKKKHVPGGVVFTASGESNGEYDTMFPKMFQYNTCDLAQFEEIYNYQTTKNQKYERKFTKEEKQEFERQNIKIKDLPLEQRYVKDPSIIVILEDLLADKKIFNKKIVRELAMNGRHQNMFAIITAQYFKDLPPPIRINTDYWFLFRCDDTRVVHDFYETHAKVHFKTFALFEEAFTKATTDHRVLFVDARETSSDVRKKFKWYRADVNLPPFRIGCDRYWRFAKKNFKRPDCLNKVIVNKYASRMASRRDQVTESEMQEVVEREELMHNGGHNRKRKAATAQFVESKPQRPSVVLEEEDEPQDAVEEEEFDELPDLNQQQSETGNKKRRTQEIEE